MADNGFNKSDKERNKDMNKNYNENHSGSTEKTKKWSFSRIFYNNTFVLFLSLICATVIWFAMSASTFTDAKDKVVRDVPITINLSETAQNDGLKIFNQSAITADISVSGATILTSKLSASDFEVVGTYSPTSTKTTGGGLKTETITLVAQKKSTSLSDYDIVEISPNEITVEVDRVKEITLDIDNEIKYTSDASYFASEPTLSETSVIISGPESSINKISRAAIVYEFENPLKNDQTFTSEITLFDQNNKAITDYTGLYLTLSSDTVEVTIPVLSKKTLPIVPMLINAPEGFAQSRIELDHDSIEVAGEEEELSKLDKLELSTPIDFNEVTIANNVFDVEVVLPTGFKNISQLETVKVTINLNGFQSVKLTTTNFKIINSPLEKNTDLTTKSVVVEVIGSEAQISKLTGDSIYGTIDMSGKALSNGSTEVPVSFQVNGANTCWVVGKYTVVVRVSDASAEEVSIIEADLESKLSVEQTGAKK